MNRLNFIESMLKVVHTRMHKFFNLFLLRRVSYNIHGFRYTEKRFISMYAKDDYIVILNPGSTSLKLTSFATSDLISFDPRPPTYRKEVSWSKGDTETITVFLNKNNDILKKAQAIGFRVVHGGQYFKEATEITESVLDTLSSLVHLAPLHLPPLLNTVKTVKNLAPNVSCYGSFDTSFFSSLPDYATVFPVPYELAERGIRKYGFHGLNHRYCSERVRNLLGKQPQKVITCHLGGGSSLSAILNGEAVDTTMGYTPLDGIMMTTRPGSLDPGVVLQLVREAGGNIDAVEELLNRKSGLLGVAGIIGGGLKEIIEKSNENPQASLAFKMFIHSFCKSIGSLAAVLNGVDALVFSGGIGENGILVRKKTTDQLSYLGVTIDLKENGKMSSEDRIISTKSSSVDVCVIPANEEWVIGQDVVRLTKVA